MRSSVLPQCCSPFSLICFFILWPTIKLAIAACHAHLVLTITSIYLGVHRLIVSFVLQIDIMFIIDPWALFFILYAFAISNLLPVGCRCLRLLCVCNSDCNAIKMHPNRNRDSVSLLDDVLPKTINLHMLIQSFVSANVHSISLSHACTLHIAHANVRPECYTFSFDNSCDI